MATEKIAKGKFEFAGDIVVPQCNSCTHNKPGTRSCKAYPKGIPVGILTNVDNHQKPLPGDHGIQFEKKAG